MSQDQLRAMLGCITLYINTTSWIPFPISKHSSYLSLVPMYLSCLSPNLLSAQQICSLFRMVPVIKLATKAKWLGGVKPHCHQQLVSSLDEDPSTATPVGFLPVYVGEKRQRFIIPVHFLSHPLFRMLLERAHREYGFQQSGLMFPCSAAIFQEVVTSVECPYGKFDLQSLIEDLM